MTSSDVSPHIQSASRPGHARQVLLVHFLISVVLIVSQAAGAGRRGLRRAVATRLVAAHDMRAMWPVSR